MDGPLFIVFLVAFGFGTGMLASLLGVGGGIFMVPMLVIVGDFSQQASQATSLLVILPTACVATWTLRRKGVGDAAAGLRIGVFGVAGAVVGALLALGLPGEVLRYAFAALLIVVGLRLLQDAWRIGFEERAHERS